MSKAVRTTALQVSLKFKYSNKYLIRCFGSSSPCPSGGTNGLESCGDNTYCCMYGLRPCDCTNSTQTFKLDQFQIVTYIPIAPTGAPTTSGLVTTVTAATTASTTIYTTKSSSVSSVGSSPLSDASTGISNHVGVELGLGLGIGIPLVMAVVGALWIWNRKHRVRPSIAPDVPAADTTSGHPLELESSQPQDQPQHEERSQQSVKGNLSTLTELNGTSVVPTELDGRMVPKELP